MKKTSLLALAVAPMILGAPMGLFAQDESVTTDPVGFVKLTAGPGELQAVGVTLLHPAVVAGTVASNTATTITLDGDHAVEAVLDSGTAYYIEVASGDPWEGERFEVDVAGSSGSLLAIASSPHNTVDLGAAALSDHTIRVRAHRTLADIFDVDQLTAGSNVGSADNVLFFDGTGFETYWLRAGDFINPNVTWRKVGDAGTVHDNLVLHPGVGMLFRNAGASPVELVTNIGEVRTNTFRQPLDQGLNLIAEGHPLDNTPNSRLLTADNGFQAGSNVGNSDNILVFDGTGFETYWFRAGDFIDPTDTWRKVGDAGTVHSDSAIMSASGGVFVRKVTADDQYAAPTVF